MGSNIRFLNSNLWTGTSVTLTASSSATGLPAAYSQLTDRTLPWRSLSQTGDQTLQIDLGSAQALTMAAIADVKLQGVGGTVKLQQAGSGGAPGAWTDVGTFPAADTYTRITYLFFTTTARWWRLYWTNGVPATPDYAETGFVGLGTYLEPTKGVIQPVDMTRVNPGIARYSVDGQRRLVRRTRYMTGTWRFQAMPIADANNVLALDNTFGTGTPFFAVLDQATGITWQAWLVYLLEGIALPRIPGNYYDVSIHWEEAR